MNRENKDNSGPSFSDPAPAFDFTKMLQQFQIPGVDFSSIVERERKNIEALAEANRIAFEGWQNLVRRQSEILQDSMKRVVDDAKSQTALKNGAELARSAFETALANMRELAEMATKSQKDAFEVIRKRVEENMEALRGKKPDDAQKR
jgi:phasin family protein